MTQNPALSKLRTNVDFADLRVVLHNSHTESMAGALKAKFPNLSFRECNSYAELPSLIESYRPQVAYSVRFAGSDEFPRDALFHENGPIWIANGGAGTDHYASWDPSKKVVTNAAGVAADMMAEYIFGCFLHFSLDIDGFQQDKASKSWRTREVAPLYGKTLVIIGLGHTGRSIALRAKAFGMTVLGTRARPVPMDNVDEVHAAHQLHQLLPRADFVAISVPLTPDTRGLIGPKAISLLKPTAILADVSRGGVVDQSALFHALKDKHIKAAALDVFEVEPLPPSSPLWDLENVLISPHCSSVHSEWEDASFDLFLRNLEQFKMGKDLFNIVDPARGY